MCMIKNKTLRKLRTKSFYLIKSIYQESEAMAALNGEAAEALFIKVKKKDDVLITLSRSILLEVSVDTMVRKKMENNSSNGREEVVILRRSMILYTENLETRVGPPGHSPLTPRVHRAVAAPCRCAAPRPRAASTLLEVLGVEWQVKAHNIRLENVAAKVASRCQQNLKTT